jgi:3-oxoacyl-[acyl-carrier protein] reductase
MTGSRELDGRVAIVTGAARNIGRAISLALAEGGANVSVVTRSDAAAAEAVASEIRGAGGRAEVILADVTQEDDVARMVARTLEAFGGLDILVNNAALRKETAIEAMSLAEWRQVIGVALDGPFLCCRAAVPHLAGRGAGAIVNIGGLSAYTGARNRAHVVAAKAGLDGLTKALAHDLADRGVTVNLVSPGLIDTVRGHTSSPREPAHHQHHATLVGRRGKPSEVAAMVRYLAGPNARYVTGQTLHVNGGAFLP